MKSIWQLTFVFLCLVLGAGTAVGQDSGYPQPVDNYLNNFSGLVLDTDERVALATILSDVRRDHDIEMTVVIVDSYFDYGTGDQSIESFATNLFNSWGVGNAERDDGILILLAMTEREVRIEVGSGYDREMNREMEIVLNEFMLPRFREGDFAAGLYRGARAIIFEVTGEMPTDVLAELRTESSGSVASGAAVSVSPVSEIEGDPSLPGAPLSPFTSSRLYLWGSSILGFLGMIGLTIRRVWRNFARDCHECGSSMVKLDEVNDDAYLEEGQRREEHVGSVNYDVWECPACGEHDIHPRQKWFSGYSRCPECDYRTMQRSSDTIRSATYSSTGEKKITKECRMCTYHDVDYVTIPMKTRSSSGSSSFGSSGGGSFGGGSSSGGGASGSW